MFRSRTPSEAIDTVSSMLAYAPELRVKPLDACAMPLFDELRAPGATLPDGRPLPPLFDFTEVELKINPAINDQLTPAWMRGAGAASAAAVPAAAPAAAPPAAAPAAV